jgi:GPH family glycoside/pentoside/hexuronide:cation symporter
MHPARIPKPITYGTKLFYGFGSVAYGVKDQGFAYLLLLYYNQVMGLPVQWVGAAAMIALIVDAALDPIVGNWSDHFHSRWGRRHPFMYAAALPVAFFYVMLWNPPAGLSHGALFSYLLVVAITVRIFITFYEIPSSALAAELTDNYDRRTSFLAYRSLFGWMGGLTMALLAFLVFLQPDATHPVGQLNPAGYAHYGVAAGILMLFAILVSARGTHAHIPDLRLPPPKRPFSLVRTAREMAATLSNRSFLMLIVAALFGNMAVGLVTSLTYYFVTYLWELTSSQFSILLVGNFLSAAMALPGASILSRRFGKKHAAVVLSLITAAFLPVPYLLRLTDWFPANGTSSLLWLLFLHGTFVTGFFITAAILIASMIADVVEDSQLSTGRRSEGLFFAANSFVQKFVSGIGIFSSSVILGLVNFPENAKPGQVDPQVLRDLVLVFLPLVTVFYLIAIAFISAYRIDRTTHEANLRRLAETGA